MHKPWQWIVAIALVAGIAFSVNDYVAWRKAETANYGQGLAQEMLPPMALDKPYANYDLKVRLKSPLDWDVVPGQGATVVNFIDPFGQAKIVVKSEISDENLPDIVDANDIETTRYREYPSTDEVKFTVLTWEGPTEVKQKAFAKRNSQLITIEVTCASSTWLKYAKTFDAVYRSFVWF